MNRLLPAIALSLAATLPAAAQTSRLATDPAMCGYWEGEGPEDAMVLTETTMEGIETFCEFEPALPLNWDADRTFSRLGYCASPGYIAPVMIAFQYGTWEPGVIEVWFQDADGPLIFTACPAD
ncbi:hypothetical protein [Psychromarinibacter sp. S121]|uniref:hypothetical protein n=1 Tax=Psychromarinibacter sp. S121 TaxID=3415127 RepID=UPI003C79BAEA